MGDVDVSKSAAAARLYLVSPKFTPKITYLTSEADDVSPTSALTKTGDGIDWIIAGRGTWQQKDAIDGGSGYDTISGYFPVMLTETGFMPTVHSVERAELMAEAAWGRIDFTHWSGLQYAEVHGTGNQGTDKLTAFQNIPLTVKIGVTDFTAQAFFKFAGADGTQSADLTVDNAGRANAGATIDIAKIADLHIHAVDNNFFQLNSNAFKTVTVDGDGNVAMSVFAAPPSGQLTKIDASAATGASSFVVKDQLHAVTIIAGSGGTSAVTNGNYADKIVFGEAGADSYRASDFHNLSAPGVDLNTTAGLDAAAVQISKFGHDQDKIDLTAFAITPASGNLFIDAHSAAQLNAFASLKAAAEFVAANDLKPANAQTVDVFQYAGSTYVFNDKNGDNHVDGSDGLIKIVNVTGITQTDFHA